MWQEEIFEQFEKEKGINLSFYRLFSTAFKEQNIEKIGDV